MTGLFLHCRAGFEAECAAELQDLAEARAIRGESCPVKDAAYLVFQTNAEAAARLQQEIPFSALVFTRQWFVAAALCRDLPPGDRVAALVDTLAGSAGTPAGAVFLETPDTNEGKALSPLCRGLQRPFEAALAGAGLLRPGVGTRRLHACLLSGTSAYIGWADAANSSPWPMGVPRLKFPRGAPSRSTLKLEEALWRFLGERRDALLRPGMTAVDLGAAPGGWTWQLVQRQLRVTAVDNGALAPPLLASGLVTHLRVDGLHFRPPRPVDWMVCDIVEKPMRVAALAAAWMAQGWCRHAIVNLKLPMKRRYEAVRQCLDHIHGCLAAAGGPYRLACKQLYHDREEVTVYLTRGRDAL